MKNYEISLYKDEELLNNFLDIWTIAKIEKMTIEEYTDVDNKYTFTQWVENRTRSLGSISGILGSAVFGIYKRKSVDIPKKKVISNKTHSWIKYYGESNYDENEVFEKVRGELLRLIRYAQELDFDAIEKFKGFYEIYKWKLAFLYSKQSMIPVFNQNLLTKFTSELGRPPTKEVEYAKMHRYLYDQKPPNISVFNYMRQLFHEAGLLDKKSKKKTKATTKRRKGRKGTNELNTGDQYRKGIKGTIVAQHHKKFQERLMAFLEQKHPTANIIYEKNFIDLLLTTDKEVHYYEVKTAQTPETCIKHGLGQLLSYSYYEEKVLNNYVGLTKKVVIFGKWKAKPQDKKFIGYINETLSVNFEYLSLEEIEFS